MMTHPLQTLIPALANRCVLVVGDVILDEYLTGRATRISREAPVPVLEYEARRLIAGGAANPAANIARLGSRAVQIGLVGADEFADRLREVLDQQGIDAGALLVDPQRPTTVKTRIMAQMGLRFPQQIARLDRVSQQPIAETVQAQIVAALRAHLPAADAVLFSDYRGGLITGALVDAVRHMQPTNGAPLLTADAQGSLDKYRGFALVKCNADDAQEYLGRALNTTESFGEAAQTLRQTLDLSGAMVITRGGDGATLATASGDVVHCPAPAVLDVFDTVGAGDTSIAVMTLALAAGADLAQAVTLANYASGIVVQRVGNYAPTPDELAQAVQRWG